LTTLTAAHAKHVCYDNPECLTGLAQALPGYLSLFSYLLLLCYSSLTLIPSWLTVDCLTSCLSNWLLFSEYFWAARALNVCYFRALAKVVRQLLPLCNNSATPSLPILHHSKLPLWALLMAWQHVTGNKAGSQPAADSNAWFIVKYLFYC